MADEGPLTPVPPHQVVMEVVRSGLVLLALVGAAALFAYVHAWLIAGIIAVVAVISLVTGAVAHPRQFRAAMHPSVVTEARATTMFRHKQVWLQLDDRSGRDLAVEIRSRRLGRQLAAGPFLVFVAGALEPGSWVVIQAGDLTVWPAAKIDGRLPRGATDDPGPKGRWDERGDTRRDGPLF